MVSERVQRRIDRLLDQVEEAADGQDWLKVQQLCEEVLGLDPNNPDAPAFLSAAERRLGASDAATSDSRSRDEESASTPEAVPASAQPASFSDGRYEVKRFLGEGGKKMVYLAQDTLLDRDVAFALIKTDGLDDVSRTRISREAQAMGRLGSHPHIVTVFDLGDHEGQPFMVVELLGGGDVEGVLEDAEDGKLSLEQAISIAVETCQGLEFAHSRGIVHRDLKPGNVWLTEDGVAKIGDFGLAVSLDRSRLTAEGMMVGTVSYMPPEQAMGGEVTPRADLYSLGAMLYEMVCGRPPFLGDDNIAIIGQHINTPPVAPTWHRSDCPRPLEALIMRLLSKDPSERPDNASDVLAALEAVDVSPSEQSISEPVQAVNVLDSLASDVFVGRQQETGELKAALEGALSGRGRLLTLVGEPGIGKTRTSQELATYAGLRGAQVLWGRCHESRGAPPYWPWLQVIRAYIQEREPQGLSSEMGAGAANIAEIISDVRERLPGLQPAASLDDPEQERFRLFDSITTFLKNASRNQPIVVILDNLHWADRPSLMLLEFLAPELADSRLLVIGTYRDVDLSRQHPLAETLGELTRERLFQRVLLRGLTEDDVGSFIEIVSNVTPPRGLVSTIHTQTEGNPLFLTEVVRLLAQEGELTQEATEDRDSWDIRIPEGVREVIGRRLNRLTDRCNETLTIGAVIGREFELRQLTQLVDDMSEDRLLEVLEEGLSARVIEEMPNAVGRYEFTHALIQQTLMAELSTTRRVRLHARIIGVFEELYGDSVDTHAVTLAYHAAEAEAMIGPDKLLQYSIMAGERDLDAHAFEDALAHFQRALAARENQTMDDQLASILFGIGRAMAPTMPVPEGQPVWDAMSPAFEYYVEQGDFQKAVSVAIHPIPVLGGISGAADLFVRAIELVPRDSLQAGYLLSRRAISVVVEYGDFEASENCAMEAISIARQHNDVVLQARSLAYLSMTFGYQCRNQEAIDAGLEAIELAIAIGDLQAEQRARNAVAGSYVNIGEPIKAKSHAESGLRAAEKLRDRTFQGGNSFQAGRSAAYRGDWATADKLIEAHLEIAPTSFRILGLKATLSLLKDDSNATKRQLEEMLKLPMGDLAVAGCAPRIAYETGIEEYTDLADTALEFVASSAALLWNITSKRNAVILSVLKKDAAASQEGYSLLTPLKGSALDYGEFNVDHLLGLLARTMGDLDDAETQFEDALTFCRKAGYLPELAWSLHDYADMLLERDDPGDSKKAASMLDEALQISTDLGMRPLMERVLSKRDILKA
ncbi:MAG: protein kinase [SAR202 cluster bacterium]|nr:protein kinase [SAR202 cluster bacterium]